MAFAVVFRPAGMTAEQYDEVIRRLEEAGAGNPVGRLYHICHGESDNLLVIDVWDSMDAFGEFGDTLMPILNEVGVDPGTPEISPVRHIIR